MTPDLFPPTSRYHGIETVTLVTAAGQEIVYLRRRFVPPSDRFAVVQLHAVAQGERLDNIAALFIGDPEQYWQLCDANDAMRPEELEAVGRVLRITLPEGVPGPSNA